MVVVHRPNPSGPTPALSPTSTCNVSLAYDDGPHDECAGYRREGESREREISPVDDLLIFPGRRGSLLRQNPDPQHIEPSSPSGKPTVPYSKNGDSSIPTGASSLAIPASSSPEMADLVFLSNLAWTISGRARRQTRAPSWSFLSIDGPVQWRYQQEAALTNTYDHRLTFPTSVDCISYDTVAASDRTGLTKNGYAMLSGPLVDVELFVRRDRQGQLWGSKPQQGLVRNSHGDMAPVAIDFPKKLKTRRGSGSVPGGRSTSYRTEVADEKYCCLWLFSLENGDYKIRGGKLCVAPPEPWFLLLRQAAKSPNAFERVGLGFWDRTGTFPHCSWPMSSFHGQGECRLFAGCDTQTVKLI